MYLTISGIYWKRTVFVVMRDSVVIQGLFGFAVSVRQPLDVVRRSIRKSRQRCHQHQFSRHCIAYFWLSMKYNKISFRSEYRG
jgi:hypothetical protein